jgi:undecaprenyl-diphosphatase
MPLWQIAILAVTQGLAELLPISSSAHVIVVQRLIGLDPGAPEMTFLLVMLHTGTMFAVLFYFWPRWRQRLGPAGEPSAIGTKARFLQMIVLATACTGVLGLGLKFTIERLILERLLGHPHGEVEHLFRNLPLMAMALLAAGILIISAGLRDERPGTSPLGGTEAVAIGIVQGLCLPLRGFSRSGATISTALLYGVPRALAEDFSFALAVVLTPPVILLELRRLLKAAALHGPGGAGLAALTLPGLLGMVGSFLAGLVALRWLSAWLERGRWRYFGYYCLFFATVVFLGYLAGL